MRKLAPNELRLLLVFCAAIFIALNLFGFQAWKSARGGLTREIADAKAALAESQMWIDAAGGLGPGQEWIQAHPPESLTSDAASTALLEFTRASADENGLKVIEENLLPSVSVAAGTATALQAKLSGSFAGVTKFLFKLQYPTSWRSVPKLIIRSDTEPPNVLVELEVHQYYTPATIPGP